MQGCKNERRYRNTRIFSPGHRGCDFIHSLFFYWILFWNLNMKCSICKNEIEKINGRDMGHNAQPVADGRCCDICNATIVIPHRIIQYISLEKRVKNVGQIK